jgi:hypothetical protein
MNVVASASAPGTVQSATGTYTLFTYTPTNDVDFLIAGYLSGNNINFICTWLDENGSGVNISSSGSGPFNGGAHLPAGHTITVAVQVSHAPNTYDAYATLLTLGQE